MSKVIEATCVGGVVTSEGVPVPVAVILSEGVGTSEGILILDGEGAFYIPRAYANLKSTLDTLSAALLSISQALTLIDSRVLPTTCPAGAGTAGPLPLAATHITAIQSAKSQIDILKGMLI